MVLASGGALGGPPKAVVGRLGCFFGPLGAILDRLGAVLACIEAILSRLHGPLDPQQAQEAQIIDFQCFFCVRVWVQKRSSILGSVDVVWPRGGGLKGGDIIM